MILHKLSYNISSSFINDGCKRQDFDFELFKKFAKFIFIQKNDYCALYTRVIGPWFSLQKGIRFFRINKFLSLVELKEYIWNVIHQLTSRWWHSSIQRHVLRHRGRRAIRDSPNPNPEPQHCNDLVNMIKVHVCLRLHVWWSIPVGRWTTNHQYYHTHTKHMYMNIFTKPSQYSLYYHRVNNSTDNQPVIHTLGNRDHSMDNLYISQHSTLNTQQSSYNHNSRSNTLYTHKENSKMTHNRHTHTRQDKTITHTQTLTVQHTIHYTGTQPRRYKSATHTPDTMDRHTHFIPTQITLQAPTLYHHNTILSYTHYTPENFILIHFQHT